MPYPVLPPELPAIVRSYPPDSVSSDHKSLLTPQYYSIHAAPQSAVPENSGNADATSATSANSAAALGEPITVGLSSATINLSVSFNLDPTTTTRIVELETVPSDSKSSNSKSFTLGQTPAELPQPSPTTTPTDPNSNIIEREPLELNADRQSFDNDRQIFTAEGNVAMRFRAGLLRADRLQVNLINRVAVAEGNVSLTRGQQVLRGQRFEFNFTQDTGVILNASGEIYVPTTSRDFNPGAPQSSGPTAIPTQSPSDRILANQPPQQVSTTGGVTVGVGSSPDVPSGQPPGEIKRIRYEAERIEFTNNNWIARNVRITNDPFSPPELELRADQAEYRQTSPLEGVVEADNARLVFDQGFSLPLFRSRAIINSQQRDSGFIQLGYDQNDRGGLFLEQSFEPFPASPFQLSITPQIFLQRLVQQGAGLDSFGLRAELNYILGPSTSVRGSAILTSLDLSKVETNLRASLRARQIIANHTLSIEYSYRDRLFNGSLGFQDVQTSFGAVLTSPVIQLGETGINLRYQAGAQYINADTDRQDLLAPVRRNNRVYLGRFQTGIGVNKSFFLWQGQPLPPTPTEGLRYTAIPVVPYLQLNTGIDGLASIYSNGDTQELLTGTISLQGQFGNFSRPFFDYTGFNIGYSQTARVGLSPFLFDRTVDTSILTGGIVQQIYGPLRIGIQTSISLVTNREISTDYILEYSRRTYGLTLRYNPVLQIGSLGLRISDFNWTGGTEPFGGSGVRFVERGVLRSED